MGRDRKPLIGIHNGKKMEDYVRDSKTLWKESFFSHTKILRACAFVSVPKTSPTVFPMSLCDSRTGDSVALGCLAQGFFPEPVTLSWNYNGSEGTVRSYPAMLSGNTYLQTSVLDLPANQCPEAYKCRAEHYNTSVDANVPCPVPPRPCDCPSGVHVSLSGPSLESLLLGIGANLTCTLSGIKNSNGATFTWVHDTAQASTLRPIQGAPEQDSNGKYRVSSVLEICTEEWLRGDTFSCTVSHSEIETTTKTIYKPKVPQIPPQIYLLTPSADEQALNEMVSITCLVRGFSPEDIFIRWLKGSEELPKKDYITSNPYPEPKSTSTYMVSSILQVQSTDWKNENKYSCVVGHEALPLNFTQQTIDRLSDHWNEVTMSINCLDKDFVEEDDSEATLWPMTVTFLTLFLLSMFYNTTVTLMKTKSGPAIKY